MTVYRVDVDGITVWTANTTEYVGERYFPDEYRGRPVAGVIEWFVNDECISCSVPEGTPE